MFAKRRTTKRLRKEREIERRKDVEEERIRPNRFKTLPTELIYYIFSLMDFHTLLQCSAVCKEWFMMCTDQRLLEPFNIRRLTFRDFPPLRPWNPLDYYNLFELATVQGKQLANYEFFNCSKYCELFMKSKMSKKVKEAKTKLGEKAKKVKNKMKDFCQTTYHCFGQQMRRFVIFSIVLQHIAFTTLLWRHWDKTNFNTLNVKGRFFFLTSIILYWCLGILSLMGKLASEMYLYWFMSILLVNIEPPKIVVFDFSLLLLTISLTATVVVNIFYKLNPNAEEKSLIQSHFTMTLQATAFLLYLYSPSLVATITFIVVIMAIVSRKQANPNSSLWDLCHQHYYQFLIVTGINMAWVHMVYLYQLLHFSTLHNQLTYDISLMIHGVEMSIIYLCISNLIESRNHIETKSNIQHPTVYWHYVWILGVIGDFLIGLLSKLGYEKIEHFLSLILPIAVLVLVFPVQLYYWNRKWNYDLNPLIKRSLEHPHHYCCGGHIREENHGEEIID